ncbi:transposase [Azospirillum doebereinerae]
MFRSGRQFAAWLGLTPKAHSGGATAVMRLARKDNASRSWATKLSERKPAKLAAVALANKTARIA